MHIMIMAQHYAPEEVSGAVLATELAEDLVKLGHRVTFVTCAPNYPYGKVFGGYKNSFLKKEMINGVTIIRTWSYISPRKTFWRRIINYGTFSAFSFLGGLFAKKPDIIFSVSPPLPLGLSAWLLSRYWKAPWVLRVEDLYPDAAVDAGLIRNSIVIKFFSAVERLIYKKSTHISVISKGFRENLLTKQVPEEKLSVTPVWADPDRVQPMEKENSFRKQTGLQNKFVVLYSGNIGYNSSLEDILDAAKLLEGEEDIKFVIVGEGVKKKSLEIRAENDQLTNVLFLPYQPREKYPEVLAASDLGVVTLNKNSYTTSLPSKVFNIMSSGRAILAITPDTSEIAHLVQTFKCGVNIPPGRIDQLANTIPGLKDNPRELVGMGSNGRKCLIDHFSRRKCVSLYDQLFHELMR